MTHSIRVAVRRAVAVAIASVSIAASLATAPLAANATTFGWDEVATHSASAGSQPQIAVNADGLVVAAWTEQEMDVPVRPLWVSVSEDGVTWTRIENPLSPLASEPSIVTTPDGDFAMAWTTADLVTGEYKVWFGRSTDGLTWETQEVDNDSENMLTGAAIAIAPNGQVELMYSELAPNFPSALTLMQSSFSEGSWSTPQMRDVLTGVSFNWWDIQIQARPDNSFVAAWSLHFAPETFSLVNGSMKAADGDWGFRQSLSGNLPESAFYPRLAVNASGLTVLSYIVLDLETNVARTEARTQSGSNAYTDPIVLEGTGSGAPYNSITVTDDGTFAVLYAHGDDLFTRDIKVRKSIDGINWTADFVVSDATDTHFAGDITWSDGQYMAIWWKKVGLDNVLTWQLVSSVSDDGETWSAPTVMSEESLIVGSNMFWLWTAPRVMPFQDGFIAGWQFTNPSDEMDIRVQTSVWHEVPDPVEEPTPSPSATAATASLATTGLEAAPAALAATVLLVLGAVLALRRRRAV